MDKIGFIMGLAFSAKVIIKGRIINFKIFNDNRE